MQTCSTKAKSTGNASRFEWKNVPQKNILNLIVSVRRRCQAAVASRGGHSCYSIVQTKITNNDFELSVCGLEAVGTIWFR